MFSDVTRTRTRRSRTFTKKEGPVCLVGDWKVFNRCLEGFRIVLPKDGHPPTLGWSLQTKGWSPTKPWAVTHQKEVFYRLGRSVLQAWNLALEL